MLLLVVSAAATFLWMCARVGMGGGCVRACVLACVCVCVCVCVYMCVGGGGGRRGRGVGCTYECM